MSVFTRRTVLGFGAAVLGWIAGRPRVRAREAKPEPLVVVDGWILRRSDLDTRSG